ncbi:MAG: hypothetical protein AAGA58_04345 [Verrucomicrobiota bacterium]
MAWKDTLPFFQNVRNFLLILLSFSTRLSSEEFILENSEILFENEHESYVSTLAVSDQYLYLSDVVYAPDDNRPIVAARVADDGSITGYGPKTRQRIVRLLLCDPKTGKIIHALPGPVSRQPRISGFGLPLTSPPCFLEDGFAYLTADWHLKRMRLFEEDGPVEVWNLDIPTETNLTPRLSDDMGYLMPRVTRCGEVLLFTFNASPKQKRSPFEIQMVAVNLNDGKIRWTRSLGSTGALDRSPTCITNGDEEFHVITPTGDIHTYTDHGVLLRAFRPSKEFVPENAKKRWSAPVWELQRIDDSSLLAFSAESPEFGESVSTPFFRIHVSPDGSMRTIWESSARRFSVAQAAIGERLYLRTAYGLMAFSPHDGRILWKHEREELLINCAWSAPVVHDGFVYFSTHEGLHVFWDDDEYEWAGTFNFKGVKSDFSPPLLHKDYLYSQSSEGFIALKLPLFLDQREED